MHRRSFIKNSTIAAGTLFNPFSAKNADEKIKLGIVGVGWWGTDVILRFALESDLFQIVGLCDVDSAALSNASFKVTEAGQPEPKLYKHYQELYDLPELQAVAIVTPTHWHPLQFIAACEKGLDVLLEKPISYDIREAQAMQKAHEKAGNMVSIDFPRLYTQSNDQIKAYIESGEAGEIRQVAFNINSGGGLPPISKIPDTMDYELFCGPGPDLPYRSSPNAIRPNWRAQHGFSRGVLADWGIHYLQNIRTVLQLGMPDQVVAFGGNLLNDGRQHPDHQDVKFDFNGLPVQWSHKSWGYTNPMPYTNIGIFYYGEKATIWCYDTGFEVHRPGDVPVETHGLPREPYGSSTFMEITNVGFADMFARFAHSIKTRNSKGIKGTFSDGFAATTSVIYADLAYRTQQPVNIDHSSMSVIGNDEAQALLYREYRDPYQHPYSLA